MRTLNSLKTTNNFFTSTRTLKGSILCSIWLLQPKNNNNRLNKSQINLATHLASKMITRRLEMQKTPKYGIEKARLTKTRQLTKIKTATSSARKISLSSRLMKLDKRLMAFLTLDPKYKTSLLATSVLLRKILK